MIKEKCLRCFTVDLWQGRDDIIHKLGRSLIAEANVFIGTPHGIESDTHCIFLGR
jgi:hypothetical protein